LFCGLGSRQRRPKPYTRNKKTFLGGVIASFSFSEIPLLLLLLLLPVILAMAPSWSDASTVNESLLPSSPYKPSCLNPSCCVRRR
jgi:hypothetical protein